ncbi:trace amine-associated receptor 6-like [Oncorhynchus mykiss]|uniref:trace amine-associated receptor 6-like n=1 Tax=Oncorhynchus mykiss TaxID=8022 RepID=UPI001877E285|nr:trace amine-associated receptor 6-like [Oncorhynchus mykiss]
MEKHEDVQHCFKDRNSSCRKALLSTSIYITLYIFFSLISAVTVFLNILVIISISHFKQLHTPTNLLILSLAASDLLVGLIVIPVMTVATMESCWGFGGYFCVFHAYIASLWTSLTLGNLVLISIDRYVAVCDPLLYHSKITITRIMCCISITWCCCIIYRAANIQYFVNVQVRSRCLKECNTVEESVWVNITDLVITMVVPCSIIITLYLKIFVVARSQARKVFSKETPSVSGVKTVQANKSERKAAKTLAIVVFNYLFCWIPSLFIFLFFSILSDNLLSYFINFLALVNSLINPIIYAFLYPWFKPQPRVSDAAPPRAASRTCSKEVNTSIYTDVSNAAKENSLQVYVSTSIFVQNQV